MENIPHARITTEKFTVGGRDARSQERKTYRKHLNIGRIVNEDICGEEEDILEHEIAKKEPVLPKRTDITVRQRNFTERPTKNIKKDVVKVGKLDTSYLDRLTERSWGVEKTNRTKRATVDKPKV